MIHYINMLPVSARKMALAIFSVAALLLFLYQDYRLLLGAGRQLAVERWPAVDGKMINAVAATQKFTDWRITRSVSFTSTTPILQVRYRFTLDGKQYIGRGWRPHIEFATTDRMVHTLAKTWRNGHPVVVHYNPQDPEESYIHAGLQPLDLLAWMSVLPFHLLILNLFYWLWALFRLSPQEALLECRFDVQGPALHVNAGSMNPMSFGLFVGTVVSVIIWIVCELFLSADITNRQILIAFAIVPVAVFTGWAAKRQLALFGNSDLILDHRTAHITLPATRWGQTPLTISYDDVRGLILDQSKPRFQYSKEHFIIRPIIIHQDAGGRLVERPLWHWSSLAPASHFTHWLMEQLNLKSWHPRGWSPSMLNAPEPDDE